MEVDEVIEICLTGIYKEDIFNGSLYLKGGQALRIKEELKSRFSADIDFSTPKKIELPDLFFNNLEEALRNEFSSRGYYLFDFTPERRPKFRTEGTPDFWGGWLITFKFIENQHKTKPLELRRKMAIIPRGAISQKIEFDISEYEYCGSVEKIKVKSVEVSVYSRVLLLVEKIRAICQQHPDYKLKGNDARSRDYYDIEKLWSKSLQEKNEDTFINECAKHIENVFKAKEVDLALLEQIFLPDFVEVQRNGWPSVVSSVSDKMQNFDYYNETLKLIISKIRKEI
jgi:predicted nucleotidyltransferase component of viral defense system